MPESSSSSLLFRERVFPPVMWWVVAALISAMTSLIVLPVWRPGGIILPLVCCAGAFLLLYRSSPTVAVTSTELYAGPAHISRDLISGVTPLAGDTARWALGPGLDARAFLLSRPWSKSAVRIDIDDPEDPTPYWIVSTREPARLAAALGATSER